MPTISSSTAPIFILGVTQRSGTNFLFDLLRLHPDCRAPAVNWEDFLIAKCDPLVDYVSAVYSGWRRRGAAAGVEDMLYERLGDGLISTLASRVSGERVVTKTPSVRNLDYFFRFFPHAYLLILVRDGRAVAESRVKTFGESYEAAMRVWADGADTILRFVKASHGLNHNYLIVRYEDLWKEPERELRRIFTFSGLDAGKYDFATATQIPVRGSSVFRGEEKDKVHWKPVEKTTEFNPVSRSNHWTGSMHARFDWLAGGALASFGYSQENHEETNFLWVAWNRALDLCWHLGELFRWVIKLAKDALKWIFGADRMSRLRRHVLEFSKTFAKLRRAFSN